MKALCLVTLAAFSWQSVVLAQQKLPDIRAIDADLIVPQITEGKPAPGKRVFVIDETSGVPFVLYLPDDWQPGEKYPVILELPGNGGFKNNLGDECTGRPEGCSLGYGISGGTGVIWAALPFLDESGKQIAITWWGSKPNHKPDTTVAMVKRVAAQVCSEFGGDKDSVFLAGFSRGALACNAIGLHDEEIAKLWRGMICYSHYDGVRGPWAYANSGRTSALERLKRLGRIPQFICQEGNSNSQTSLNATKRYLEETGIEGAFTFCPTGFRNHNDAWVLRPSPARAKLREWFLSQCR